MSLFERMETSLQKDLIAFVEAEESKPYPKTLSDVLSADILRKLISGDCKMTGCCTNHKTKKMYIEYTFYQPDEKEGGAE